ncbi:relaxase/mobilization nuclease domain-containing protein [Sphingobacterium detergens]|uniref:Relaxase/mobilization nuclease-like protein n=1 Tax=Sphingobacterium detergens TaxID=1145106 RepID=A0A420ARP2_SPHD1|nr:relaxase/mobilization nuclease domain-containing protein [Sphingobacterium detergens]RKE47136.1 relaxase/mobilization nuclease-like protein [Sphingobacterium detergens]
MVAVVHVASSLRRVLNYNEQKVKEGVATCIDAPYYLKDADRLTFNQKLGRLQKLADLNERTKVNAVHISLNFPPQESHSQELLKEIAGAYLQKIGFAEQPYLLYQHFDAGHPHVHILTTNIKADGKRIPLHNIGKVLSEKARKELEIEYNLIKASEQARLSAYELQAVNAKLEYGKSSTKRAITGVLNTVLNDYKFTSLGELNAVLSLYNVSAEPGEKDSRMYKNKGLVYRIKKEDGTLIGTPIKASSIFGSPTLKTLGATFSKNKKARLPLKSKVKVTIDFALFNNGQAGLKPFIRELRAEGIDTVLRHTKDGRVFGITFVDHKNSCVFNGSALGDIYGAAAILLRSGETTGIKKDLNHVSFKLQTNKVKSIADSNGFTPAPFNPRHEDSSESLMQIMFQVERDYNYLPYELSAKKKKKQLRIKH